MPLLLANFCKRPSLWLTYHSLKSKFCMNIVDIILSLYPKPFSFLGSSTYEFFPLNPQQISGFS